MDLTQLRIRRLELDDARVFFTLANGVRIDEPLKGYLQLERATPLQRLGWQLTDDAYGVDWPALVPASATGMINVLDLLWDRRGASALRQLARAGGDAQALPAGTRAVAALRRLDGGLNTGGFLQFLGDWGDASCQLALQALLEIGAPGRHTLVAGMRETVARFEHDASIRHIDDVAQALNATERRQLASLEAAYYDSGEDLARLGLARFGLEG